VPSTYTVERKLRSLFGSLISIRLDQVYSDFGSRAFRCLVTVYRGTEDAQLRNLRSAALCCRRALHWLRRIVGGLLPGLYPVRISTSQITELFAAVFGSLPASSGATNYASRLYAAGVYFASRLYAAGELFASRHHAAGETGTWFSAAHAASLSAWQVCARAHTHRQAWNLQRLRLTPRAQGKLVQDWNLCSPTRLQWILADCPWMNTLSLAHLDGLHIWEAILYDYM
jgi:hypothetical protein